MDIPNYQDLYRLVLDFYSDKTAHALHEAATGVADHLKLTTDQRAIRTSTGTPIINNRVSWAHTYLLHAGLLNKISRGVYRITVRGIEALEQATLIDNHYLEKFEEFNEFKNRNAANSLVKTKSQYSETQSEKTPEEQIDIAFKQLDNSLSEAILDQLRNTDPIHFEQIVADLLERMGYGKAHVTQRTVDGGIDAIIDEDALGLSKIYAQAKRYAANNRVNRKELQNFVGALQMHKVSKGVFITTSYYNEKAKKEVNNTQQTIVFIDGAKLSELMVEYGLGVSVETTYRLKRLDADYFEAE